MTVLEAIRRSGEFLAQKGLDSPRLQAESLLAHVRRMPRLELYLEFDRALTDLELSNFRELIRRRSAREPLQHIIGVTSFCGYEIAVNRQVLIPRPETEQLAELGWQFLQEVAQRPKPVPMALDVGTGSGCLVVALAKRCGLAIIHGVDFSPEALEVAQGNAATHELGRQTVFFAGDLFSAVPPGSQYDLILSNPPYIPRGDIAGLAPEVRDYEPRLALDGGEDGMTFYRRLAWEAPPFLAAAGRLMFELGDGQEQTVRGIMAESGWRVCAVHPDDNGKPRILIACREV